MVVPAPGCGARRAPPPGAATARALPAPAQAAPSPRPQPPMTASSAGVCGRSKTRLSRVCARSV
ncbi:MAG: hypothetical protein C0420_13755 [Methylobacterium sp.]|nr:hypothetical protein [Methylobacterium sp.]